MYFRGWVHSWFCKDCPAADTYWRLRAFWAGVKRKSGMPKRCPDSRLWRDVWEYGNESGNDELEF